MQTPGRCLEQASRCSQQLLTSQLLLCAGQGPERTVSLTPGTLQHPLHSATGRRVREGQRRPPTAQSTSTGGRVDAGRKPPPPSRWPLKGELGERLSSTWREAWGCHWSCWQGQSGTNELESGAYWAPLGLSVIAPDHRNLLRMVSSSLLPPSKSHTVLHWPTLTQNPTEKGILGNAGPPPRPS